MLTFDVEAKTASWWKIALIGALGAATIIRRFIPEDAKLLVPERVTFENAVDRELLMIDYPLLKVKLLGELKNAASNQPQNRAIQE